MLTTQDKINRVFFSFVIELQSESKVTLELTCCSADLQTIYGSALYGRRKPQIKYERKYIIVPDGGCISIDITPINSPPETPVVIVLHGILGGSHAPYVQSAVSKITLPSEQGGLGYRAMVFNLRGCSNTPITSPLLYHPGMTDDLRSVILYATYLYPNAKLFGLGFSLGAGYLTNYLGEQGEDTPLISGLSISNVWDYSACSTELSSGRLINRILYNPFLGKGHQMIISKNRAAFESHPQLKNVLRNRSITMSRITDEFMAPLSGTEPTQFLYDTSCSKSISHIRIPVLCLNTRDDPLFPAKYLPIRQVRDSKYVCMLVTEKGGHLAWLQNKKDEDGEFEPWHTSIIVEYFRTMSKITPRTCSRPSMSQPDENGLIRKTGRPNVGFREVSLGDITTLVNNLKTRNDAITSCQLSKQDNESSQSLNNNTIFYRSLSKKAGTLLSRIPFATYYQRHIVDRTV
ncbi:hypothetical protein Clacol_000389 [Clathrus columnatus]|uniref:AB hydrolase-1 domain-containing protein n=1 Tax=Clathrus columnatus TaxID=1419009 RepID=A0AAV4ZZM4_9AGAM|nr:hypothetical protein Clacol_000389 [Clathrus columnatus]